LHPVTDTEIRLQKVLAAAGIGSRRSCEILIDQGRVSINGEPVREQGRRVDPEVDIIHVDGERLQTKAEVVVYALNKPKGVLTTMVDDQGRACVGDYVTELEQRVFHVGRLDADTEGLLLLTNDGELANRLIHPSFGVDKTYIATVKELTNKALAELTSGVQLDDGTAQATKARIIDRTKNSVMVEVVIHEGRNRIVRRMFDAGTLKGFRLPGGNHRRISTESIFAIDNPTQTEPAAEPQAIEA
jgi:23S rRNA pseudouridine2605 synthase